MATAEVESAAHDLVVAVERLTRAIDSVGDDRLACQYVPFKVPITLEHLALRLNAGQTQP